MLIRRKLPFACFTDYGLIFKTLKESPQKKGGIIEKDLQQKTTVPVRLRFVDILNSTFRVWFRLSLIIFAAATAAAGIGAAAMLDIQAGYFECPNIYPCIL